jgi:hypothetical protein
MFIPCRTKAVTCWRSLEELKFVLKIYVKMVQPENNINYPFWYY